VGSKTPAFFRASAATGRVEFTGFVTTQHIACGHVAAISVKISRIILALVWDGISKCPLILDATPDVGRYTHFE
jgi:hypothetical protein